jgi:hypothetical protein
MRAHFLLVTSLLLAFSCSDDATAPADASVRDVGPGAELGSDSGLALWIDFTVSGCQERTSERCKGVAPLSLVFTQLAGEGIEGGSWSLGDGEVLEGRSVVHTYQQPGLYGVTLSVAIRTGRSPKRNSSLSRSWPRQMAAAATETSRARAVAASVMAAQLVLRRSTKVCASKLAPTVANVRWTNAASIWDRMRPARFADKSACPPARAATSAVESGSAAAWHQACQPLSKSIGSGPVCRLSRGGSARAVVCKVNWRMGLVSVAYASIWAPKVIAARAVAKIVAPKTVVVCCSKSSRASRPCAYCAAGRGCATKTRFWPAITVERQAAGRFARQTARPTSRFVWRVAALMTRLAESAAAAPTVVIAPLPAEAGALSQRLARRSAVCPWRRRRSGRCL